MNAFLRVTAKFLVGDGCWEWTAAKDGGGYGSVLWEGRVQGAHRVVYEMLVGPIPAGMELDHLCRNHGCVRPSHVEPVPHKVNMLRGEGVGSENAAKTHCVNGHPLLAEHLMIRPDGTRKCRTCKKDARRRWRQRNPGKVADANRRAYLRRQERVG